MRKKIVAGNWKCNTTLQAGLQLAASVFEAVKESGDPSVQVVICPPFISLAGIAGIIDNDRVKTGAQNCGAEAKGAFTGEVSAAMVKSTGAEFVILGHSERREYYGETSETLNRKLALAFENQLTPIYCCGEPLAVREAGTQNGYVKNQLEETVFRLSEEDFRKIVIAYEPIWAIGTGKTATSAQAQEMHAFIRSAVLERYGEETAGRLSLLYGGSCKSSNAAELFANPDVDGGLIGGASLDPADFLGIVNGFRKR